MLYNLDYGKLKELWINKITVILNHLV